MVALCWFFSLSFHLLLTVVCFGPFSHSFLPLSLSTDSNLHTYNIQNNDVLEFAMDEEQVQERKPIELEGYLQKEGQKGLMKLWKHRWFSTQVFSSILFYCILSSPLLLYSFSFLCVHSHQNLPTGQPFVVFPL